MITESIIVNNNPETVSTDFNISDKLYFDPLTEEEVLNIVEKEKVEEVLKLDLSKYQLSCVVPFGYRINEQSTQLREPFENIVEYIK